MGITLGKGRQALLCNERPLVKETSFGFALRTLECRSWNCVWCRKIRKRQVIREATQGNPQIFVTLTLPAECADDPARWAAELVTAWRKFVRFYKKRQGYKSIPYFAVFEATKAGTPHLHILCRVPWIKHGTLSWFMEREVAAPIVYVERVRHRKKAANYLGKYMGKSPGKFGFLKRYWQTTDYGSPDPQPIKPRASGFVWWRRAEFGLFEQALMSVSMGKYKHQVIGGDHYFITQAEDP